MCLSVIPKLAFMAASSQFCLVYAYCNAGIWWITGLVWRLQTSSVYASGEIVPDGKTENDWIETITAPGSNFQYESGMMVRRYYVCSFIVFPATIVFLCVL